MNSDKIIVIAKIHNSLAKMNAEELVDVLTYVEHCNQVNEMTDPKSAAMIEIEKALKGQLEF